MARKPDTILLVDNNDLYRASVRVGLELAGFQVLDTGNKQDVSGKIRLKKPALAIVDIRLVDDEDPGDFTGLLLLSELPKDIPVIVLTAYKETQFEALLKMNNLPEETPRPRYCLHKGDAQNLNNIITHVQLVLSEQHSGKRKAQRWLYRLGLFSSAGLFLFGIYEVSDQDIFIGVVSSVIASVLIWLIQRYYQ
jgi:CheY-like chemotaxis protein